MKAYARIDGVILGADWLVGFACFVGMFHYPICGMLCMIVVLMTPFLVAIRLGQFRDHVLDGFISFRRAFGYSLFTFMYASIILAVGVAAYFQFMDHGFIADQFHLLLSSPEVTSYARKVGYSDEFIKMSMEAWRNIRPIELAMQTIWSSLMLGGLTSVVIALVKKRERR